MDISEKKTTLDDSASIYQKREEKTDKEKWRELKGFKAKWEHFKAYYLLKVFIWVCVIGFVGYAIYEMVAPDPERMLYVAILDTVVQTDEMDALKEGYEEYISLDEETQDVYFDNMIMVSNKADPTSAQKFTAHAFVGDIDIIIAREGLIKEYAGYYLRPLSDQLPADLYEALSEKYCYARAVDADGNVGEELPYGVYIGEYAETSPYYGEPIVLAIVGNSKRADNAEAFVRYLLERKVTLPEASVE
ncbi:MAG: hypothetical protein E7268_06050 [Lachnospiraceae bacterium]|nr:hypothetical protein [Lachnospiraceae bacterium]